MMRGLLPLVDVVLRGGGQRQRDVAAVSPRSSRPPMLSKDLSAHMIERDVGVVPCSQMTIPRFAMIYRDLY